MSGTRYSSVIGKSSIGVAYLYFWKKIGFIGLTKKFAPARWIYTLLVNKLYLDVLYTDIIVGTIKSAIANACYWINQNIIDGFVNMAGKVTVKLGDFAYKNLDQQGVDGVVNSLGTGANASGSGLRLLQSGKIQRYAAFLFTGVIVLAFVAVMANNK